MQITAAGLAKRIPSSQFISPDFKVLGAAADADTVLVDLETLPEKEVWQVVIDMSKGEFWIGPWGSPDETDSVIQLLQLIEEEVATRALDQAEKRIINGSFVVFLESYGFRRVDKRQHERLLVDGLER